MNLERAVDHRSALFHKIEVLEKESKRLVKVLDTEHARVRSEAFRLARSR